MVRAWLQEATELLWRMPETCELDVAERGGLSLRGVARLLGTTHQQASEELARALRKVKDGARHLEETR